MSARTGRLIGLGFALLWLWIGAGVLPAPLSWVVLIAGAAIASGLVLARRRPSSGDGGSMDRRRYLVSVGAELVALLVLSTTLGRAGRVELLVPLAGVIIGLHFIGLWWASGRRSFLALSGTMTGLNAAALFATGPSRLAICGFGNFAALAAAAALG